MKKKDDKIVLTKAELYEMVWKSPATHLSKKLGISDVAIAKICKKNNIPKPWAGYWQQLSAGYKPKKTSLPESVQNESKEITIQLQRKRSYDGIKSQLKNHQQNTGNKILVKENLYNAHPLVREARTVLNNVRVDEYGRLSLYRDQKCLDIRVSKASVHRALRIIDALIKEFERREVEVKVKGSENTVLSIRGEEVKVYLFEPSKRKERELTKEEKNKPSYLIYNRYVYQNCRLFFYKYSVPNGTKNVDLLCGILNVVFSSIRLKIFGVVNVVC